jgi:hypothetical protein
MTKRGGEGVSAAERRRRLAGAIASAVLIGIAVVLALVGGGGGDSAEALDSSPRLATTSDLVALEASAGHPIYWAGPRAGTRLELTEEADGSIYLRYLSPGVEAGDPEQRFLTVGTYPVVDAVGALRRTALAAGMALGHAAGGGVILSNPSSQGSVYLAYPGSDIQIEVYDPVPGRSLELIRSGAIGPVSE